MGITKIASCNYYGTLKGRRYGNSIGLYIVDEAYKRLLEKHEEKLAKLQHKMIADLRLSFSDEIRAFKKDYEKMAKRLSDVERTITRRMAEHEEKQQSKSEG